MLLIASPADLSAASATNVTSYAVRGLFLESRSAGKIAVIAHENIPGYMEPMTMPFNVKKPQDLQEVHPGDRISFHLFVSETDAWIDEIKKLGADTIKRSARFESDELPELQPGAPVPDCVLTNQAGQTVRLSDFHGQALAMTFFFARCPLPTLCPRMNNNFASVQKELESDGTRTNWHLLSISFDPSFDTPEFLGSFATAHQNDPLHWSFATSSSEDIRKLGGAFGLKFRREAGSINHNLRTVVVSKSGRVQRVFRGNEWQPAELVSEMKRAMKARP